MKKINVELGGGLELLFNKQKTFQLEYPPEQSPLTIQHIITSMSDRIKDRKELFTSSDNKL
jgi:hypothetical protein